MDPLSVLHTDEWEPTEGLCGWGWSTKPLIIRLMLWSRRVEIIPSISSRTGIEIDHHQKNARMSSNKASRVFTKVMWRDQFDQT